MTSVSTVNCVSLQCQDPTTVCLPICSVLIFLSGNLTWYNRTGWRRKTRSYYYYFQGTVAGLQGTNEVKKYNEIMDSCDAPSLLRYTIALGVCSSKSSSRMISTTVWSPSTPATCQNHQAADWAPERTTPASTTSHPARHSPDRCRPSPEPYQTGTDCPRRLWQLSHWTVLSPGWTCPCKHQLKHILFSMVCFISGLP